MQNQLHKAQDFKCGLFPLLSQHQRVIGGTVGRDLWKPSPSSERTTAKTRPGKPGLCLTILLHPRFICGQIF